MQILISSLYDTNVCLHKYHKQKYISYKIPSLNFSLLFGDSFSIYVVTVTLSQMTPVWYETAFVIKTGERKDLYVRSRTAYDMFELLVKT